MVFLFKFPLHDFLGNLHRKPGDLIFGLIDCLDPFLLNISLSLFLDRRRLVTGILHDTVTVFLGPLGGLPENLFPFGLGICQLTLVFYFVVFTLGFGPFGIAVQIIDFLLTAIDHFLDRLKKKFGRNSQKQQKVDQGEKHRPEIDTDKALRFRLLGALPHSHFRAFPKLRILVIQGHHSTPYTLNAADIYFCPSSDTPDQRKRISNEITRE